MVLVPSSSLKKYHSDQHSKNEFEISRIKKYLKSIFNQN